MPELPEVETVVRGIRGDLSGRVFTGAKILWPNTSPGLPSHMLDARIKGQCVESVGRRAKYIVIQLEHDTLFVHLKMTGRLYIVKPDEEPDRPEHLRAVFGLDDGRELRFYDMRKFGKIYLVADPDEIIGALGPEPLSDAFTLNMFVERMAKRSGVIKPLLLNQTFVAGLGNIYADESLWGARIDPRRSANTLTSEEIEQLYNHIRSILSAAIEHEGSSFSWYLKPDGKKGDHQNHFTVYDREGEPCLRCGTAISKIWLAQRGTHYCSNCQF